MKDQKHHFIIQTNFGGYWAGMNVFTDQMRKAQMYNSIKEAKKYAEQAIKRHNKSHENNPACQITSYRVITVSIVEHAVSDEILIE